MLLSLRQSRCPKDYAKVRTLIRGSLVMGSNSRPNDATRTIAAQPFFLISKQKNKPIRQSTGTRRHLFSTTVEYGRRKSLSVNTISNPFIKPSFLRNWIACCSRARLGSSFQTGCPRNQRPHSCACGFPVFYTDGSSCKGVEAKVSNALLRFGKSVASKANISYSARPFCW